MFIGACSRYRRTLGEITRIFESWGGSGRVGPQISKTLLMWQFCRVTIWPSGPRVWCLPHLHCSCLHMSVLLGSLFHSCASL